MFKVLCIMLALIHATSFTFAKSSRSFFTSNVKMLNIGDLAPDFELKNYNGKSFKLSNYRDKKSVVVFFYPADSTPGCTTEVCAFEKRSPDFKAAGAEVFGVSSGGEEDKKKFIATNKLQSIELLIDEKNVLRNAWKVPRSLFGALPGRVTYVIGKDGLVKSIYDDLGNAEMHPEKALEAVQKEL